MKLDKPRMKTSLIITGAIALVAVIVSLYPLIVGNGCGVGKEINQMKVEL